MQMDARTHARTHTHTHVHLTQGTRPSKKLTNIHKIPQLLRDSLLLGKKEPPFVSTHKTIIAPPSAIKGLMTALHVKLVHPSNNQLKSVTW